MKALKLFLFFFTMLLTQFVSAHTMWVQVAPSGKKGVPQQVKVFFGEFSWGQPTQTAKWFSDIKDYRLMVTAPDGTTTELTQKQQDSLCYITEFTPDQDGVYTFWFHHEVKDVYKDKKLTYTSAAFLNVNAGKKDQVTLGQGQYQLSVPNPKKPDHIIYLDGGKAAANQVLEIVQEGNKEGLTVMTNDKGEIQFPKDWKGNYLIEIPDSKKVDPTDHNGKVYEYDYKTFSYYLNL